MPPSQPVDMQRLAELGQWFLVAELKMRSLLFCLVNTIFDPFQLLQLA